MGRNALKSVIVIISLITSIAFLAVAVIATWQIFSTLLTGNEIRGELWVLLILAFTAGVIMILLAWGITELGEARRQMRTLPADEPADA